VKPGRKINTKIILWKNDAICRIKAVKLLLAQHYGSDNLYVLFIHCTINNYKISLDHLVFNYTFHVNVNDNFVNHIFQYSLWESVNTIVHLLHFICTYPIL